MQIINIVIIIEILLVIAVTNAPLHAAIICCGGRILNWFSFISAFSAPILIDIIDFCSAGIAIFNNLFNGNEIIISQLYIIIIIIERRRWHNRVTQQTTNTNYRLQQKTRKKKYWENIWRFGWKSACAATILCIYNTGCLTDNRAVV